MGKVLDRAALIASVRDARAAGRTVAFANGCFDILHVGHVRYLESAAREGDVLVVAINDDDSVRALKGEGRPILAAEHRAELVAALRCVDFVLIFPEPTVAPLLEALHPDVHCKGTDYTVDTVPERETVKAYGGRIAIVGDPKDHSTRDLLTRDRIARSVRPGLVIVTEGASRFLIVRLGSLGDVIHAIPAVAALRRRYPDAIIDWVVDPRYVDLLKLVTAVDRSIPLDPRASLGGLLSAVRALRQTTYEAAIDLQGLLKSATLARGAGAGRTIGYPRSHLREPLAAMFYTESPDPGPGPHVIHMGLGMMRALDVTDATISFPLTIPESAAVDAISHPAFALINPGAAWPNKRWPPARFGALAKAIADRRGLASIVLWGPGEESMAAAVVAASGGAASLAPPTSIADIVALSSRASVMVSGDTGPLHIAGAVGTPIVALFGPTKSERNGPWNPSDISLTRIYQCICHYERRCRRSEPCIDDISVEEVASAVVRRVAAR